MSPRPNVFDIGTSDNALAALLIISPDEHQRAYSITDAYVQTKPHVPGSIYPFAVTGTGDYVCFDYRESASVPRVVFYFAEESGDDAIYNVASNFTEFLNGLHE